MYSNGLLEYARSRERRLSKRTVSTSEDLSRKQHMSDRVVYLLPRRTAHTGNPASRCSDKSRQRPSMMTPFTPLTCARAVIRPPHAAFLHSKLNRSALERPFRLTLHSPGGTDMIMMLPSSAASTYKSNQHDSTRGLPFHVGCAVCSQNVDLAWVRPCLSD